MYDFCCCPGLSLTRSCLYFCTLSTDLGSAHNSDPTYASVPHSLPIADLLYLCDLAPVSNLALRYYLVPAVVVLRICSNHLCVFLPQTPWELWPAKSPDSAVDMQFLFNLGWPILQWFCSWPDVLPGLPSLRHQLQVLLSTSTGTYVPPVSRKCLFLSQWCLGWRYTRGQPTSSLQSPTRYLTTPFL